MIDYKIDDKVTKKKDIGIWIWQDVW